MRVTVRGWFVEIPWRNHVITGAGRGAAIALRAAMRCSWTFTLVLTACTQPVDPVDPMDPIDEPTPDPAADPIAVTLDALAPGARVTISRFTALDAPREEVRISDGSPIVLTGTATDVFAATVTDEHGTLTITQLMGSRCTPNAQGKLLVPSQYPTIQAAVDAARPGQTVAVAPGVYRESIRMRLGVCLVGSGARDTILEADGAATNLVDLTAAPGSAVVGFTLRGTRQDHGCAQPLDPFACSGNWYRAGIYLGGESWADPTNHAPPLIANNAFHDNDVGVMLYWRGNAIVRNNVFLRNRVGFVANHFQNRALVANNVFQDNFELAIGNQAAYLDIVDNVIANSEVGIRFQYIQTGHIRHNIFYGNGANQASDHEEPPRFTIGTNGNIEVDPRFAGPEDFHLLPDSPARDAGAHGAAARELDGTLPDIGVYGGPLAAWTAP